MEEDKNDEAMIKILEKDEEESNSEMIQNREQLEDNIHRL